MNIRVSFATIALAGAVAFPAFCQYAAPAARTTAAPQTGAARPVAGTTSLARNNTPYYSARENYGSGGDFYEEWIKDRLSIGLSFSTFSFTDNKRATDTERKRNFIGAVTVLEEEDDFNVYPVLTYGVNDYFRVGLGYDKITGRTYNFNNQESDGNVVMKGPMISFEGSYPFMEGMLTPHAGVGFTYYYGNFEEDTWWHLGYSSLEAWQYYGSPNRRSRPYFRVIRVDDDLAVFFNIGLAFRPIENFVIDFSVRKVSLDPDCEWGHDRPQKGLFEQHNTGDFDLSHWAYALSLSYLF